MFSSISSFPQVNNIKNNIMFDIQKKKARKIYNEIS